MIKYLIDILFYGCLCLVFFTFFPPSKAFQLVDFGQKSYTYIELVAFFGGIVIIIVKVMYFFFKKNQ